MDDNIQRDVQSQEEDLDALPRFQRLTHSLRREQYAAEENEDEIRNTDNSNIKEEIEPNPEDRQNEISNQPRPGSMLSSAIQAYPNILQHEPPRHNLIFEDDSLIYGNPLYLSNNPNNPYPDSVVDNGYGEIRESDNNPPQNEGDRHTPEILDTETEAFTPAVSRRKAQYQQVQQMLVASRSQKQRSEDQEVVPESSAQGAQCALASTSRISDASNVNGGNTTVITGGSEGPTIKEKSSRTNNPSAGEPSSTIRNFSEDGEQLQFGSSSNSNSQAAARPSATPHQQHQRTFSNITGDGRSSEIMLPRWQPDSEVEECPICHKPFSFFSRKHHCRKCGRVVCNACSPHRITIPYQYIVQPPTGFDGIVPEHARTRSRTISQNSVYDSAVGGGMKVRLCNPCVPDPNISPPTLPLDRPLPPLPQPGTPLSQPPARSTSNRERVRRSELCPVCGDRLPPSTLAIENHIDRCITRRLREVDFSAPPPRPQAAEASEQVRDSSSLPSSSNNLSHSTRPRHTSEATTLGNSTLSLNNFLETNRYPSVNPATPETAPSRPFLSSRMICFAASQLDTIGEDSECIICMEDFEEGVEMARLECLCKYHKKCIDGWFFKHPGRCPVHGQDNY